MPTPSFPGGGQHHPSPRVQGWDTAHANSLTPGEGNVQALFELQKGSKPTPIIDLQERVKPKFPF